MINITLAPDDIRIKYPEIHLDVRMGNDIYLVMAGNKSLAIWGVPIPHWRFTYEEQELSEEAKIMLWLKDYHQQLFLSKIFGKSKHKDSWASCST